MKAREALRAARSRWSHPALWLGAAVLPAIQAVPFLWVKPSGAFTGFPAGRSLLVTSLLWSISLFLVALPFQWTGDDRPQAGFWRGLAQWLVPHGLLTLLLLALCSLGLPGRMLAPFLFFTGLACIGSLFTLLVVHWIVARGETQQMETGEAELRARAAERLVHRNTLSPRLIHDALQSLLSQRDPNILEAGLVDLAVLFRSRLMAQNQEVVPFHQEHDLARLLLQVVARSGRGPQRVHCSWEPALESGPFPSLVLVRLLETLLDLLLHPAESTLTMTSAMAPGGWELTVVCTTPGAPEVAHHLGNHPTVDALERRLAAWGTLREPLAWSSTPEALSCVLRVKREGP